MPAAGRGKLVRPGSDLRDGGGWESAVEGADDGVELAGGHEVAGFPNGGARMPWADLPGIRPSVEAEHVWSQGRSDVHGAAVHADHAPGAADQPDQFRKTGLVEETVRIGRQRGNGKITAADQDYRKRVERLTERHGLRRSEGFAPAAAERMKQDGVFRDHAFCQEDRAFSRRQRKERRALRTEGPGETQGSVNGVGVGIDRDDVSMKEPGAFAAIAEADAEGGAAGTGGQAAAEEALKIQRDIRLQL
mgnify:CR=1 FL=1